MSTRFFGLLLLLLLTLACGGAVTSVETAAAGGAAGQNLRASATRAPAARGKGERTAVFAGGCFWGVEAVFEHVKGVTDARSGYSGGTSRTANYELVAGGRTQHAEAVRVTYDPSQVSYEQLLAVFFTVAHDPTQLNRQGPDVGTQYRSAIFYADEEQKRLAESHISRMTQTKAFAGPVVTQIVALKAFYEAEEYHQDYLVRNPDQPYIVAHDLPKLEDLRKRFPELYAAK